MKTRLLTALLVSAIASAFPWAANADDRKDIESLYAKLSKALSTNNFDATLALETPDFKSKGMDGKTHTGKELADQMKADSAQMKLSKMDIKIAKLTVKGKTASVDTDFKASSESIDTAGMMGPKGKKHVMGMNGKIHNELVKTKDGWKFKTMEEKSLDMTLDGKPFDPSKMGGPPPVKK